MDSCSKAHVTKLGHSTTAKIVFAALLVTVCGTGCMADAAGARTDTELQSCDVEESIFADICLDYGESSQECETAAENARMACDASIDKALLEVRNINEIWLDGGRECYESQDLQCLHRHFKKLVYGWRWIRRYPLAARAMDNFLECRTDELRITGEEFTANLGVNQSYPEAISAGELQDMMREEARTQAAETAEDVASFDLGSALVVSRSQNLRYAIGRTTVYATAELDRTNGASQVTIRYQFRDRYDFHPTRADDSSDGQAYEDAFPYHAWAALLVDNFHACEFDHVGEWEETIDVP